MKHFGLVLFIACHLLPCRASAQQAESATADHPDPYWINLHNNDDLTWSQRIAMSLSDFKSLRRTAGIADDEPFTLVELADARTLPDKRILLVSASGNGHCLKAGVYERRGTDFLERWSVQETPNGGGFCREYPCRNPSVTPTKQGAVLIVVPLTNSSEDVEECDHAQVFTYRPSGKTYQLTSQETSQLYCDLDTYLEALEIAFGQDVVGERVVTLHVLPSFQRESAVAIDKASGGLVVSRITFQKQLWSQLGLGAPGPRKAPSQCIDIAKAAHVERRVLPLPKETAQRLVNELSEMDFTVDKCPRAKDGTCVYVMDGRAFELQFDGRSLIRLTDVSLLPSTRSENPALSGWIAELLREIDRLPQKGVHHN